jgi:hypothetical protein
VPLETRPFCPPAILLAALSPQSTQTLPSLHAQLLLGAGCLFFSQPTLPRPFASLPTATHMISYALSLLLFEINSSLSIYLSIQGNWKIFGTGDVKNTTPLNMGKLKRYKNSIG